MLQNCCRISLSAALQACLDSQRGLPCAQTSAARGTETDPPQQKGNNKKEIIKIPTAACTSRFYTMGSRFQRDEFPCSVWGPLVSSGMMTATRKEFLSPSPLHALKTKTSHASCQPGTWVMRPAIPSSFLWLLLDSLWPNWIMPVADSETYSQRHDIWVLLCFFSPGKCGHRMVSGPFRHQHTTPDSPVTLPTLNTDTSVFRKVCLLPWGTSENLKGTSLDERQFNPIEHWEPGAHTVL